MMIKITKKDDTLLTEQVYWLTGCVEKQDYVNLKSFIAVFNDKMVATDGAQLRRIKLSHSYDTGFYSIVSIALVEI